MEYDTITVTKLSPHVGAEIGNIDLTKPLTNRQVEEVHHAFCEHCVVFFRDQKISFDDHLRFARYFGELHYHVGPQTSSKATEENPAIRRQHFDKDSKKVSGEVWHTDQSCAAIPPKASVLYNHTIPPDGGGDTLFASMYAAYDGLSERMKSYLSGLTATHDGHEAFGEGAPVSVHPVIARHPVTGRKLLYVNSSDTIRINELPKEESDHVLRFLLDHCRRDEWTVRFRWRNHSIAFWDNRSAQHKAIWDYWPNTRSGYRIQIKGEGPPLAG
jgi:taurine dioxygenase